MTNAPEPRAMAQHPVPLASTSLTASARRITSTSFTRKGASAQGWQEDAWEMYDLVGEQRFLATTLAGRLAQARLYVGRIDNESQTDDPVPVEGNPAITDILDAFGNSPSGRGAILNRMGVNLFVAGDGWLVGIPQHLIPEQLDTEDGEVTSAPIRRRAGTTPVTTVGPTSIGVRTIDDESLDIADLEWRMLSVSEVSGTGSGTIKLQLGDGPNEKLEASPNEVWLIRVWRPHPRRWWEADSPTRSSLPVLRELVGLTMHISAQVDSRLAGAGLLIIPQSAARAIKAAAGLPEDSQEDPFTEALLEAMLKPIQDRANASALVPLVITVPDEAAALFNFITFAKPLDTESRNLREEAIRRLALGQDAPPELLLGTGGMNHWGAWLVQEDVVSTHLEPPLALICDALTTQYLWPVLIQQGMTPEEAENYVIWYDVSDLVVRPNRSQDAVSLFDRGVIGAPATRGATGFDESDAPEGTEGQPVEVTIALGLLAKSPALAQNPGLPALVNQIRQVLSGEQTEPEPVAPVEPTDQPAEVVEEDEDEEITGQLPDTIDNPVEVPDETPMVASGNGHVELTSVR